MISHPPVSPPETFKEIETHYPKPDKKQVDHLSKFIRVIPYQGQFQEKTLTPKHIIPGVVVGQIIIKIQEVHRKVTEDPHMKAQVFIPTHCQDPAEEDQEVEVNMTHMDLYPEAREEEGKNMEEEMELTEEITKTEVVAGDEEGDTFQDKLALKDKLVRKNMFQELQAKEELIHSNVKGLCRLKKRNLYMNMTSEGQVPCPEILSR